MCCEQGCGVELQGLRLEAEVPGGGCVVIQARLRHWTAGRGSGEKVVEKTLEVELTDIELSG